MFQGIKNKLKFNGKLKKTAIKITDRSIKYALISKNKKALNNQESIILALIKASYSKSISSNVL